MAATAGILNFYYELLLWNSQLKTWQEVSERVLDQMSLKSFLSTIQDTAILKIYFELLLNQRRPVDWKLVGSIGVNKNTENCFDRKYKTATMAAILKIYLTS